MNLKYIKSIEGRLIKKSKQSHCTYKIVAAAYTKNGNLLGFSTNNIRLNMKASKKGAGIHAERELIKRFGNKVKYILISRYGASGQRLPIHPCEICQKIADEKGIKIIPAYDILKEEEIK